MKGKAVSSEGENFTAAKVFCLQKNEALLIVDAFFQTPYLKCGTLPDKLCMIHSLKKLNSELG